ncbi:hypothetical protein NL676_024848 [Syzygium grande]|nr:hypothetical protein NL676_024848 [Syzygium grande]
MQKFRGVGLDASLTKKITPLHCHLVCTLSTCLLFLGFYCPPFVSLACRSRRYDNDGKGTWLVEPDIISWSSCACLGLRRRDSV